MFHQFSAIFHDFQWFSSISSIFTDFCRFVTKVPTSVPIVCRIHSLNFDKRAPTYCPGEKCPEQCANFGAPNLACRRGPFCAPDSHFPRGSVPILVEKHAKSARAISYLNHRSCGAAGFARLCPNLPGSEVPSDPVRRRSLTRRSTGGRPYAPRKLPQTNYY